MIQLPLLHPDDYWFPAPDDALPDPDGLLAAGGDLSQMRLLHAYMSGIFPWYQALQPILWWSPSVRALLLPENLRISRSLRKTLRKNHFTITADTAFSEVIRACAAPRSYADGTWITPEMQKAYTALHQAGHAHSLEVWAQGELVGGLYGVTVGGCYFGESMFSRETDSSKVAFVALVRYLSLRNFALIDCQMMTPHLESLGATPIARSVYLKKLQKILHATSRDPHFAPKQWVFHCTETAQLEGGTGNPLDTH
ncbi:Leucyl/phenylalanyl-tRNA--protein transferase [gamma proteobacterium HdN1]|nr:Leucyl/phenylalanyl-tRNA--protein transferase [gamma proteobacterium HdN1]